MKHKIGELEGALLDAAVAMAEGLVVKVSPRGQIGFELDFDPEGPADEFPYPHKSMWRYYKPSQRWDQAGPLIERERITIVASGGYEADEPLEWSAEVGAFTHYIDEMLPLGGGTGKTPLIAAMRAFVASKLGDEVELPAGEMNG